MLITEKVTIKWHGRYREYYKNKGYIFTKFKDEFDVKVEDLQDGSNVKVKVNCDCKECKNPYLKPIIWQDYLKGVKEDGKYYCNKCAKKLFGNDKYKLTRLKNGKSFEQWCYDNLMKDVADIVIARWDENLNIDEKGNVINPKDVNYSSNGINKRGYWFKCLDHPEHGSELKNIHSFTSGAGSITCNQCNSVLITHPILVQYFVNKEDALKYSVWSHEKILLKCLDCGYEKKLSLGVLLRAGFGCQKCGDGVSYPEKFTFSVLEQLLDKDFKIQLSKTTFDWCKGFKYDNYIEKINSIIETGGLQHYEEITGNWKMSLKDIQINDFDKEWLARSNNIKNYIILDCRKSELEWIKNSIMQSRLPKLLSFKESDIDWLKCHEYACNSLVKVVCDMWSSGIKTVTKLIEKLKISRGAIIRYLKQGVKLGWCDYDPKEILKINLISMSENNYKKVICLTTGKIFGSQKEAKTKYNIKGSSISMCCKGQIKSAGRLLNGEKLKWMYYDEYLEISKINFVEN